MSSCRATNAKPHDWTIAYMAPEIRELRAWEEAARAAWAICTETAPGDCPGPDAVRAEVDRLDDKVMASEGERDAAQESIARFIRAINASMGHDGTAGDPQQLVEILRGEIAGTGITDSILTEWRNRLTQANNERDTAYAKGRADERADVVAWLIACYRRSAMADCHDAAMSTKRGDHVGAAKKEKP